MVAFEAEGVNETGADRPFFLDIIAEVFQVGFPAPATILLLAAGGAGLLVHRPNAHTHYWHPPESRATSVLFAVPRDDGDVEMLKGKLGQEGIPHQPAEGQDDPDTRAPLAEDRGGSLPTKDELSAMDAKAKGITSRRRRRLGPALRGCAVRRSRGAWE